MGLMDGFNEVTDQLINKLYKVANGNTQVSMHEELSKVTLDAIGKVTIIGTYLVILLQTH